MRHEAIYSLYPSVVTIDDTAGAFDASGNPVEIDEEAISAEVARLTPILNNMRVRLDRQTAYEQEADPLFFKAQRGEATMQEWQDKVEEIKQRFPKE
jgi:hypothetical protein